MTDEEIKRVAEEAAKAAVEEMFVRFGIDDERPSEMRKDFQHLRSWREAGDTIRKQGLITAVGVVTVALLGLVWATVTGKMG